MNEIIPTIKKISYIDPHRMNSLYERVSGHIESARQHIQHTIDVDMIKAYWFVGQEIVEEEPFGKERSGYGKAVLKGLSKKLQQKYKKVSASTFWKRRGDFILYFI